MGEFRILAVGVCHRNHTGQLAWGCVFTCFSSAAVHRVKNYTILPALGSFDSSINQYKLTPLAGLFYLCLQKQSV